MSVFKIAGIAVAALVIVRPSFAQTTEPVTPAQQPQQPTMASDATQIFTGCLMTEPAYRRAHNLGDGALGGVGLGDEFVLVDAKVSPAPAASVAPPVKEMGSTPALPATSACADKGTAYRLHGSLEDKMKGLVGHQLEVTAKFKHADDVAADGTQPGAKLPAEIEIVSYREAPAPTTVTESAPVVSTPPSTPPAPAPTQPTVVPPPAPVAAPVTPERRELPHTASSTTLVGAIGLLALAVALGSVVIRRRIV